MAQATEILVVDDDRMALVVLEHQLLELGYATHAVTSGAEALQALDQEPDRFAVAIVDRMMPDPDGIALTREIARRDALRALPVIMATGADSPEEMKEGIDAGVFYYITKPVKKPVVQSVVGAALRQRKFASTLEGGPDGTAAFGLIEGAKFAFRTVEEAEMLAGFIANTFPEPQRTVNGAAALMVNAVEHGLCQIGHDAKGALLREGQLSEEIEARLAANPDAKAHAVIAVKADGVYLSVSDPGPGFDWKEFMSLDMSRNAEGHGRGIVRARTEAFDKLAFQGNGNTVVGFVGGEPPIQW